MDSMVSWRGNREANDTQIGSGPGFASGLWRGLGRAAARLGRPGPAAVRGPGRRPGASSSVTVTDIAASTAMVMAGRDVLGDGARDGGAHALHGEHAGGVQPERVPAQIIGGQGHQALLEQQGGRVADRGDGDRGHRDRQRRMPARRSGTGRPAAAAAGRRAAPASARARTGRPGCPRPACRARRTRTAVPRAPARTARTATRSRRSARSAPTARDTRSGAAGWTTAARCPARSGGPTAARRPAAAGG